MQRHPSIRRVGCAIAAGAVLSVASGARADVIHVPGDYPTNQAAIDASQPTGDEIIVAPGTYGPIDFIGHDVRVYSSGGAAVTTIAASTFGVVKFMTDEGPDAILEGFTVTGGETGIWIWNAPFALPRAARA